ncbi:hypothetical protein EZS27_035877, partial [termite gut metagenome]
KDNKLNVDFFTLFIRLIFDVKLLN